MDTVTQALLGGAIGFTVCKQSRRRGMLWGAGIAVLPDLDIFIPHATDLDNMTMHRSWSHSWIIQTLLTPLLAYLCLKIDKHFDYRLWLKLIWLALVTHSALDALTVYGTQLFWPLMPPPISGGSVFIIDPVYSLPLLLGFLLILFKPLSMSCQRIMSISFMFSCLYLTWGLIAQQWVLYEVKSQRSEQQLAQEQIKVIATPFNTLLWRVLITDATHYSEAYVSVFDNKQAIEFTQYDRNLDRYPALQDFVAVKQIAWFTHDFYKLETYQDKVIASDLRMGLEPDYVFRFNMALENGTTWIPIPANRARMGEQRDIPSALTAVWQRIWHQP